MNQPVLRSAYPRDYPFCERLYFAEMGNIITQLNLDMARQRRGFAWQWNVVEVRIITMSGEDIGWLQTKTTDGTLFLGQLYISGHKQRQGIGTRVLQMRIEEARRAGKPVTLKINPARGLYERHHGDGGGTSALHIRHEFLSGMTIPCIRMNKRCPGPRVTLLSAAT